MRGRRICGGAVGAALLSTLLGLGCGERDRDLVLVGTVERTLVEVAAPVAETIDELPVQRGQHVEAGAVLARLDPLLADADLASAQAELARAQAAHTVAEHDHRRALELHRSDVASEQQLERARLALDETEAAWRAAAARLAAAQKRRADLVLRAPSAGVVDQIPFDPGERVPAGAVLAVLLADGAPWVRVWIPERAVARVRPGDPATVEIDGIPRSLPARVLEISREPAYTPHYALTERERVNLVYESRVEIVDAPAELRPGVPAEVRIPLGERVP